MENQTLLYKGSLKYDLWLELLLGGILALTLILGLVFMSTDTTTAWILLGITLFDAILFWLVLPQRLLIYEDRLVIQLGKPLAVNVPLADIKEVKPAEAYKVFMYWGNRFATSTSGVLEIVRHKGMGFIVSPADTEIFLDQLDQARQSFAGQEQGQIAINV